MEPAAVDDTTRRAVAESNIEDLRVFIKEVEETDMYAIKKETLRRWVSRLTNITDILERHIGQSTTASKPAPAVAATATNLILSRRRESLARPRTDVGAPSDFVAPPATVAAHVASAVHLMLDSLRHLTHAEWSTCFLFVEATQKLVMIGGAGKRQGRPGDIKLDASVGVEHLVMENGIGVCMGLATAEKSFSDEQDKMFGSHSKSVLIFPMFKPGSSTSTIGVIEVGNRVKDGPFTEVEETAVADAAFFIANLVTRFPNDITNPHSLDTSIFQKSREIDPGLSALRQPLRVYRTGLHVAPRRLEMMRDSEAVPRNASVEDALDHIATVSDSWRSAVLLNVELEHEIRRLHEALRISRRETARLQEILQAK